MTTNMPTSAPARKVVAATAGAGAGSVIANLVLWGLDDYVFAPSVHNSVPNPVSAFVLFAVPVALAFVGGYLAKRGEDEIPAPSAAELVTRVKVDSAFKRDISAVVADAVRATASKPARKVPAKKAAAKKASGA